MSDACLGRKNMDDALAAVEAARAAVNVLRALEPNPPIAAFESTALDSGCLSGTALKDISTYLATLFNTGLVQKLTRDTDGGAYPQPTTKEELDTLKSCEPSPFWEDWDEIYTCMGLDKDKWGTAFTDGTGCMDFTTWNDFWLSVNCMAPGSPCSPCDCPVCDSGPPPPVVSCYPCYQCMTVLLSYGENMYLLLDLDSSTTPGMGVCLYVFSGSGTMVNSDGVEIPNWSAAVDIQLVKGWVFYSVTLYYTDSEDPPVTHTYHHVVNWSNFGSDVMGLACSEVGSGLNPPMTLLSGVSEQLYDADTGTAVDSVVIWASLLYPIVGDPWKGVLARYQLAMGDIPVCTACALEGGAGQTGTLLFSTDRLILASNNPHHNRAFDADVFFDNFWGRYRLTLRCGAGGDVYWTGTGGGCGDPKGLYSPDPHPDSPFCFTARINIT